MDKYVSRGHLTSGAPLDRTLEVSISSMLRATRIRDLPLPYSSVQDLYLNLTGGTLDTIVFPVYWDLSHTVAVISFTLDRDHTPPSIVTVSIVNPSSTEVVRALNDHPMLKAVNEQGYLRVSASDEDVNRIRVNDRPQSAGQAQMCHIRHGIFKHVYVDRPGSTPDPRSYGIRGAVKSSPSRVETPTTNLSSYIQRHEDRTSSGINRAVDSVASNIEFIRDKLGSTRLRHQRFSIPLEYSSELGETPIRWHREGDSVTAVVVDGSLLEILLPVPSVEARSLYALTDKQGNSLIRGSKDVDLLDIYGTPDSVFGKPADIVGVKLRDDFILEGDSVADSLGNNPVRVSTGNWYLVDETTIDVEDALIGKIAKGDLVQIASWPIPHTFEVAGIPRDGRINVKSASGSLLVNVLTGSYSSQTIPPDLTGNLIVRRGVQSTVTEWVYLQLKHPIRIQDLADVEAYISLPVLAQEYDFSASDKPSDPLVTLNSEVSEFLLRMQGPLYRDLSAHMEINLQSLHSRQGLGSSVFNFSKGLLLSPRFIEGVPLSEDSNRILSNVDTANYGAPITFKKNSASRYRPIQGMSTSETAYFDRFSSREEGLKLSNCEFNPEHNLLTLVGDDKGTLSLKDQGRTLSLTAKLGGVTQLSSARMFVIVEVINRSRARLRPVIGSSSITPTPYPDIGEELPCTCRFVPPVIADELTEYAATMEVSPSLRVGNTPFSGQKVSLPTHRPGYGGKDHISLRGGLIDRGGELHLESLSPPNLNLSNVALAAKVEGNTVKFLIGGTELLSSGQQGMQDVNVALYNSLIAPILAIGQENSSLVEGRSPATLLDGALLNTLRNLSIPKDSYIAGELKDLGLADLAVQALVEGEYSPEEPKIYFTFEPASHVKVGASPYPINNSERVLNLFTGMYELSAVNVLDNGAVELLVVPRPRVSAEMSFLQTNAGQLAGATSNSTGYYVLGSASFYTVAEETKEFRGTHPTRTIKAGPSKSGLAVDALKGSYQGIEVNVGEHAKGIGINTYSLGKGIEVRGSSAEVYANAGKSLASDDLQETIRAFSNPGIDVDRLLLSPFVFTNFVSTAIGLGGDYASQVASLTAPSGSYVYPDSTSSASPTSDFIFRGSSAGIRSVGILPDSSDLLNLGSSVLSGAFVSGDSFTYREPSLLVGTKEKGVPDPSMYGSLSAFSNLREEDEKRSNSRWSVPNAAAQIRGDLHVTLGDLVIVPDILNEAYRGDLKYYDYLIPHVGYFGAERSSGVGSHLVPVGDAGILPMLNREVTPNKMSSGNQEFGQRKVVEPDHHLLSLNIDTLPIDNDARRLNYESSYSQAQGRFSGSRRPYGRGDDNLVVSGKGLAEDASLLQTSSTRILGEPRKVSRWSDVDSSPIASRSSGDLFTIYVPSSGSNRFTQESDIGRACRVGIRVSVASDILRERKLGANEGNFDSELDFLLSLLTSSGKYLTDSLGAAGLVQIGEYTGIEVTFCGIVADVSDTYIQVYGPRLSELLDLPTGGDDNLWSRVSLLSISRVTSELFGKRWDLNASTVAADHITLTDTGANSWAWGSDVVQWLDTSGNILDYLPRDEVIRITPTSSGSFFRNDVYFYGDLTSRGGVASFERLSATSLLGSNASIDLDAGFISDSNNVVVKDLYDSATRSSSWSAMNYLWASYRTNSGTSGINAHQQNKQVLPLYASSVDNIVEGHRSIGVKIDDSVSTNLIKSSAYVHKPTGTYPQIKVHRRDTGFQGSLYVNGKDGYSASTPAFRSGVTSISSSILFDLSGEKTELHVCAYSNPNLTISEGIRQISIHEFDVYNADNDGTDRTTKEIHVTLSCGADLRDGVSYLHRVTFPSGVLVEGKLGSVYRYKYLFFVNIVDKETRYVQDTYIIQANPVSHQINVPHIRPDNAPKYLGTGEQTRGVPAQYSVDDAWGDAHEINQSANLDTASNVMPTIEQLAPNNVSVDYEVASYAFTNDIVYENSTSDPNLPMFKDSIFGEKWSLIPTGNHVDQVSVTDSLGNTSIVDYQLNGGFVGFLGEYFVPFTAQEDKLYIQPDNRFANTVGSYAPALREAFSSIAELTPTRYVIKLPKPSSEWVGREFKVSVPTYSTHTAANPFLGAWSESRKVGSLSDYFFYVYRGYWSEHEGDSGILECVRSIEHTKNVYASHLIPVVSPTGLIGSVTDGTWPFNAYTGAQVNLWNNHLAIGLYNKSDFWVNRVLGVQYDPDSDGGVALLHGSQAAGGGTAKDIFFRSFGEPTYTIPYLHTDEPSPPYPGYLDVDVRPGVDGASKLSYKAESADILVVCDTSYIADNNMSVTKNTDIVDAVSVKPSESTKLCYTCVPQYADMVDTTVLSNTYARAEGVVYRWVKI